MATTPATFPTATAIADINMVIENLEDIRDRLLAECQEHGAEYTKFQEGKFEGAFFMVRGVLVDELYKLREAWENGNAASRKGEEILAATPTDPGYSAGYDEGYARARQDALDAVHSARRDTRWDDDANAYEALGDLVDALDPL